MRNIKLWLEYDGTRYCGWQKSAYNHTTAIVDKLSDVIEKMTGKETELIGAVRTEAGVHALGQIANFKTDCSLKLYEIKHYLNSYLPKDIAVLEVSEVPERFHSNYLIKEITYEYRINYAEVESVFDWRYQYYSFHEIDTEKMKQAASYFLGKHDFSAFVENKKMKKSTERTISKLEIYTGIKEASITVTADDFWPGFVRILVGTLLAVGRGEKKPQEMEQILKEKRRELAGETAEARGLFLSEVHYS